MRLPRFWTPRSRDAVIGAPYLWLGLFFLLPFMLVLRISLAQMDGALQAGYAGIRPKISGPGQPAADFVIQGPAEHGIAGLVKLFGIESPGLTSCLAIGDWVARIATDIQS